MNYLVYIEHAAENLQFYLWYRNYLMRFNNLPPNESALAPEWTADQVEAEPMGNQLPQGPKQQVSTDVAAVFKGTDFAAPTAHVTEIKTNPFNTPPRTPQGDRASVAPSEQAWSERDSTLNGSHVTGQSHHKKAAGAFEGADVKWQPCMSSFSMISVHGNVSITDQIQSPFNLFERRFLASSPSILLTDLRVSLTYHPKNEVCCFTH